MEHRIFTGIRGVKLMDACKATQMYAVYPPSIPTRDGDLAGDRFDHVQADSTKSTSNRSCMSNHGSISENLSSYGLPGPDSIEPQIEPFLHPLNLVDAMADMYRRIELCPHSDITEMYLEQFAIFQSLSDPNMLRQRLRSARQHAVDVHTKVVLSAWLRFEKREDELAGSSSMDCFGRNLECPVSSLVSGYNPESVYDPCVCRRKVAQPHGIETEKDDEESEQTRSGDETDIAFLVGDDEVRCVRHSIASLSKPLKAMLYGGFAEARRETINFSQDGISVTAMRAVKEFTRNKRLDSFSPNVVLELLTFANRFCCDEMKSACDTYLASMVTDMSRARILMEYGLAETAHALVASCLQVFLRELPASMEDSNVRRYFCGTEGREKMRSAGHASFLLYFFLSQVSMEEDVKSNVTVMLLETMTQLATLQWQKQLSFHQLGCVMLARKEYKDAQHWFQIAVDAGHVYSSVGIARAKFKRGHKYKAYRLMDTVISDHRPTGWMYQERSLYCDGKEKMMDLDAAHELDPRLSYPFKYRSVVMAEGDRIGAAVSEISRIIRFRVSPDCLELRSWFLIAMEDYDGALRDVRALLTLDHEHAMFNERLPGDQVVDLLRPHVRQWSQADCWMQLYDRWSCVDDIGCLAVVHQMLANDPGKSLLRFRQSLLLLGLNCQKASLRSLRQARNHSLTACERLVYQGWLLYDTGHRDEAIKNADDSIAMQRSFEAFFLKAYALSDSGTNYDSSPYVIQLLEDALRCPSDGLRKGQALSFLGDVYVNCNELDLATNCYTNALNIKHTRAHQGLARVYNVRGQRKDAYDEMTKLIEKARNNASAYEKRAEYCDTDMAKSDLMRVTQLDPLRTHPYRYRASALMDDDDQKEDEAIAEVTKAIEIKPDVKSLHIRAAFNDSAGDSISTLRDCEATLCLDPNYLEILGLYQKAKKSRT